MAQAAQPQLANETKSTESSEDSPIASSDDLDLLVAELDAEEALIYGQSTQDQVLSKGACRVMVLGQPPAKLVGTVMGSYLRYAETVTQRHFAFADSTRTQLSDELSAVPTADTIYFLVDAGNVTLVRYDDQIYALFALNDVGTNNPLRSRTHSAVSFLKCTAALFDDAQLDEDCQVGANLAEEAMVLLMDDESSEVKDEAGEMDAWDEAKESVMKPPTKPNTRTLDEQLTAIHRELAEIAKRRSSEDVPTVDTVTAEQLEALIKQVWELKRDNQKLRREMIQRIDKSRKASERRSAMRARYLDRRMLHHEKVAQDGASDRAASQQRRADAHDLHRSLMDKQSQYTDLFLAHATASRARAAQREESKDEV